MLVTFQKTFFQAAISQWFFPKWLLTKSLLFHKSCLFLSFKLSSNFYWYAYIFKYINTTHYSQDTNWKFNFFYLGKKCYNFIFSMFKKMNKISKPTWDQSVNKQGQLSMRLVDKVFKNIIARIAFVNFTRILCQQIFMKSLLNW